jgi:DNA-binding XRE family transcriptional regulator
MAESKLKKLRENLLLSRSELARRAGISLLTVSRIENGKECRMETKRKILKALGLEISDKEKVF